jgi:hypothetical protein
MDLHVLADLSQIAATLTIIGGTIFGFIQLSEYRKQRRDAVAGELMRAFMSPELSHAVTLVRRLPDAASAEQLRQAGPEVERAAVQVTMTFETMGLLVFERITPFELVENLCGGIVTAMWHKLGPWLETVRAEQAQPSWAEWFQWLAQQLEHRKAKQEPAYSKHREWTP